MKTCLLTRQHKEQVVNGQREQLPDGSGCLGSLSGSVCKKENQTEVTVL